MKALLQTGSGGGCPHRLKSVFLSFEWITLTTGIAGVFDIFRILSIDSGPPANVIFMPASTLRVYTLQSATNLVGVLWADVPGQGPRPGSGGQDAMSDGSGCPARFYRIKVEVP